MPKDDKLEFEGFLVYKDLDTQVREAGENHRRHVAAAYERMDDPSLVAAQQAAYEAALPEMLALPPTEVRWPADNPSIVLHEALDNAEHVAARRRKLRARVGHKFRVDLMLSLERYALAAMHAFKVHRDNPAPSGSLPKLVHECAQQRYRLALGCHLAFGRKREFFAALNGLDASTVPESIAYDMFLLRRALIQSDPETRGASLANFQELIHSERLANTLLQAAANPSLKAALAWPAADIYARAYTLVHRAAYEAELGLVELDNLTRPDEPYGVFCPFCQHEGSTILSVHEDRYHTAISDAAQVER